MPTIAPLKGLRVLDFGQVWAGPLLGVYLSDFGAEVIQVTSAARAAVQASAGSGVAETDARIYSNLGRNRRAITLDPSTEAGKALLHRLVAVSDIVFDNFSPRAALKLGLDYSVLSEVNPRVVVCSMSAAGQRGPWSDVLTYGPSLTALYGLKSLLGYAHETTIQEDVADLDPTAATYALIAVLAALRARERTGRGQFIDMAQGEAGVAGLAEAVLEYGLNGRVMGPTGNRHRAMAPHGIYPTSAEDSWISISVDSERAWHELCRVLACDQATRDPRFRTMFNRLNHQDELDALVGERTAGHDKFELTEALQAAGVAAFPVLDAYGLVVDEQLSYRRARYAVAVEGIEPSDILNPTPWLMAASPPTVYGPSRPVGADNDYVFRELLGLEDIEMSSAQKWGAFG